MYHATITHNGTPFILTEAREWEKYPEAPMVFKTSQDALDQAKIEKARFNWMEHIWGEARIGYITAREIKSV